MEARSDVLMWRCDGGLGQRQAASVCFTDTWSTATGGHAGVRTRVSCLQFLWQERMIRGNVLCHQVEKKLLIAEELHVQFLTSFRPKRGGKNHRKSI